MALASVTPGTGGRGSPGLQASGVRRHFPRGATLRPAQCPPPPRACARARSHQLPSPAAPRGSPANRAGPRTTPLALSGLGPWAHVPASQEAGGCRTAPAPQSPCNPVSRRCAARRPALSMRASQLHLGRRGPGRRRSQRPLPVTHVPPCATPNTRGYRKAVGMAAV